MSNRRSDVCGAPAHCTQRRIQVTAVVTVVGCFFLGLGLGVHYGRAIERRESQSNAHAQLDGRCPPTIEHISLWYDSDLHAMQFYNAADEAEVARAVIACNDAGVGAR